MKYVLKLLISFLCYFRSITKLNLPLLMHVYKIAFKLYAFTLFAASRKLYVIFYDHMTAPRLQIKEAQILCKKCSPQNGGSLCATEMLSYNQDKIQISLQVDKAHFI